MIGIFISQRYKLILHAEFLIGFLWCSICNTHTHFPEEEQTEKNVIRKNMHSIFNIMMEANKTKSSPSLVDCAPFLCELLKRF